ncbi:ABC transporter ATP-binding protein (plasmid) [Aquicoccus sp. G2-2]|uniref:ABC transporter ATP-binding protein n=1 Tax=Aquicoccus sp. G2-2 TaxID=3092120 RepID=UPI002ADF15B7|nr:ABC transporter ATP-binding protein [Aquicoccus sp. G2-2]MEA1112094.1 ABC transporter ATP-binding protein [Aquicoccus sp. G2-2]
MIGQAIAKTHDATGGHGAVHAQDVVKRYGDFTALKTISLTIGHNEFFTLLGPSGCGKTTLLRMIAGFESVTEGEILLYGEEIKKLPAHKRPVNTVFQNYALFPHMTILQNVMFGLEMRGTSKSDARTKSGEMLELVHLSQYAERKPSQLSGGQQQRVALARALAPQPKVLLLDEPLSALDLKLRQAMRAELKELQQQTGVTFIFVTHDQDEALTMSDRIAVMSAGELQQLGSPREIYEQPLNRFVADFIGETNLLGATIEGIDGTTARCRIEGGYAVDCPTTTRAAEGAKVHLSIRPERISLKADGTTGEGLKGIMRDAVYSGSNFECAVQLENGPVVRVLTPNSGLGLRSVFQPGATVEVHLESGAARLLAD